jgi:hypothetical protein
MHRVAPTPGGGTDVDGVRAVDEIRSVDER